MTFYRQCVLEKGSSVQVSWIPEQFANAGKFVRLRDDDGWHVREVGSHRQSEDYVQAHERDHMGHRSRTDI